jgi:hypothetical protein
LKHIKKADMNLTELMQVLTPHRISSTFLFP